MVQSPVFKSDKEVVQKYPFLTALQLIREGKRVTKLQWANNDIYCFMKDKIVSIHIGGKDLAWTIHEDDYIGDDYIILPQAN